MDFVTGNEITTYVMGGATPSAEEIAWAAACAAAVNAAITHRLGSIGIADPPVIVDPSPAWSELEVAARIAGAEAFKRKEAMFGLTGFSDMQGAAVRVARDYIQGVAPLIDRWASPGIA